LDDKSLKHALLILMRQLFYYWKYNTALAVLPNASENLEILLGELYS